MEILFSINATESELGYRYQMHLNLKITMKSNIYILIFNICLCVTHPLRKSFPEGIF